MDHDDDTETRWCQCEDLEPVHDGTLCAWCGLPVHVIVPDEPP